MLEPPDLPNETILGELHAHYGIQVAALVFLPIGNDSASWAYRVEAAHGSVFFLKVRGGTGHAPGVTVPDYLHRHGIPHVLAPLPTRAGAPAIQVPRFTLVLYPMIDGGTGADVGLSADQWSELGAVMRQVHTTALTPELTGLVSAETFRPSRRELVDRLEALLARPPRDDPVVQDLARLWRARRRAIHALLDHADAVGRRLAKMSFPRVLCHADLHTWNVLVGAEGALWIVDWDEAVLAPKERDLMFVVGGIGHGLVRPGDTDRFFQGYGAATIDQRLLAYYRTAWAVQDIAAYGEEVCLLPRLGEESRRAARDGFEALFEPGNIVDLASGSIPVSSSGRR